MNSNRWLAITSLFLLSSSVASVPMHAQVPETPDSVCIALCFSARPETQLFKQDKPVIIVLSIYTRAAKPIFVSRLTDGEFVKLSVLGPDGNELPRQGRILSRAHTSADFARLETYHEISATTIISLKDGAGFVFDKPGQYAVTAEYSLGSPESFAPFAGETTIPTGIFRSTKAAFCIEACIREPLQVQNNAPQSALNAVRVFYTDVTRYRPLGIPDRLAKKALWPLLSKRLTRELDALQACDADYYRLGGDVLKGHQVKPATPWLEEGLFTGPNDAATPLKFSMLGSRAIGNNRVDVHLGFTSKQTYCCGHPPSYDHWDGVATTILENNRWVIDDYVAMYENDELIRLSDGYRECEAGRWVGKIPH
jgi:hypothetical protein